MCAEAGGLLFPMGDARALAATMHRACTETGLWERLVASLPQPPTREAMVEQFAEVYRGASPTRHLAREAVGAAAL